MAEPIRIAVTGAAGQITYSLLFRLASGAVFGPERPVHLTLLEIPPAMRALEGVVMELEDCAFPSLVGVKTTDRPEEAFDGVNWALLVGSKPRGPGMERADLIRENGPIFVGQGKALNRAASNVRALVVGNPCNTNALIALSNSDVPREQFCAMMMLDKNRAQSMLAIKAGVPVSAVTNLAIWGNHSNNQYPDFENARIQGRAVTDAIQDLSWLQNDFVKAVQVRGAEVIKARGASSAASAANAIIDTIHAFSRPTPAGDWVASAVISRGEYGVDPGLMFGYPLRVDANGQWQVAEGLAMSDWARGKFDNVHDELRSERDVVKDLLG